MHSTFQRKRITRESAMNNVSLRRFLEAFHLRFEGVEGTIDEASRQRKRSPKNRATI